MEIKIIKAKDLDDLSEIGNNVSVMEEHRL